jgi:CRP-like cAMP-binding protein
MSIPEEKQKYADIIRQLIPVNELPPEVQNEIIKNAELIELKKKSQIFKQGDRDNFSCYLLDGEIQLEANNQVHNSIVGASDRARYPMAQLQPRQFSGIAKVDSMVMRIDRNALDKLLVMHQGQNVVEDGFGDGLGAIEVDEIDGDEEESVDWMTVMLQSEIFSGMPISNIHQLFALLEPIEYKVGDNVITQGETGQNYYIIQEGRCEVLRQTKPGMKELKLAALKAGDGFGEEALITETTRNATIRMITDGVVAQLSKDNFVTLIQNTALKTVSSEVAAEIVAQGGKWLDVRFKNEHDRSSIEGSLHIPLNILRMQADKLDSDIHYIAFCDTGGRSSTASFLLTERGFTISYLDGGLVNHIELAPPEDVTQAPKMPESVKAAPAPPKEEIVAPKTPALIPDKSPVPPKQPAVSEPEQASDEDDEIDPEIMATVLDAELTRTNMDIERASKQDQTVIRNQETGKKLEQERSRIEEEKKRNEADILKMRQLEEQRLKKLEDESKIRMEEDRKKIEEVYLRNAEEMERLEKMKQDAEEKMKGDQERLEKEAEEARKNKQDTDQIRLELEAARKAMEEESEKRQLEQDEMRKNIEMEVRKTIEIERRKQEKLVEASEKAKIVEKDEESAVVAQQVNQEVLTKKKAEEEALTKQLQADLEGFKGELEEQEKEYANATTQLAHMKRIKERALAAKKAASESNSDLLSDISGQLGKKD